MPCSPSWGWTCQQVEHQLPGNRKKNDRIYMFNAKIIELNLPKYFHAKKTNPEITEVHPDLHQNYEYLEAHPS